MGRLFERRKTSPIRILAEGGMGVHSRPVVSGLRRNRKFITPRTITIPVTKGSLFHPPMGKTFSIPDIWGAPWS